MNADNIERTQSVSIIVPVYNGEAVLKACLDSLMRLDYPKESLEIIVVDNNSRDSTASIINKYPVKYVFEKKRGRASARNAGIRKATGNFIAFIDADCIADIHWLKNIMRGFSDESVAACGGGEFERQPKNVFEKYFLTKFSFSQKRWLEHKEYPFPILLTFNAVFKRKILEEIGMFDEEFLTSEDVDLSLRLHKKGYVLNYVDDAFVSREYPATFKAFCSKFFSSGFSYAFLYSKHKQDVNISSRFISISSSLKGIVALITRNMKKLFASKENCFEAMAILGIIAGVQSSLGMICGSIIIRFSSNRNTIIKG